MKYLLAQFFSQFSGKSLLSTYAGISADLNLRLVAAATNGCIFQIIDSLTRLDCKCEVSVRHAPF